MFGPLGLLRTLGTLVIRRHSKALQDLSILVPLILRRTFGTSLRFPTFSGFGIIKIWIPTPLHSQTFAHVDPRLVKGLLLHTPGHLELWITERLDLRILWTLASLALWTIQFRPLGRCLNIRDIGTMEPLHWIFENLESWTYELLDLGPLEHLRPSVLGLLIRGSVGHRKNA